MRASLGVVAVVGAALLAAVSLAAPRKPPAEQGLPQPKEIDVSAIRDLLEVLHDGKEHYLAYVHPRQREKLKGRAWELYYSSGGKEFFLQHTPSRGSSNDGFSFSVFDPRIVTLARSSLEHRKGKTIFTCDDRDTSFTLLEPDKARDLVRQAKFFDEYWDRVPHALARDDAGVYYYVDRLAGVDMSRGAFRGFRVFVGPRGRMRLQKMKDVVNDVLGQIFTTPKGQLRLLVEAPGDSTPGKAAWIVGKKRTALSQMSVSWGPTRVMVYRELGVYSGIKLHMPCDDL